MSDSPPIRVRGLRRRYGRINAVDGIDLDIAHGETVAVLGPNGAGKTTTLEILEGLRARDAGEVRVLDVDPRRPTRAWRYGVGIVLQKANDLTELTVSEAVRHFAGYYPDPYPVAEVLALTGLQPQARARARTLSGGQRRRLDVAIGIVGRPRLLFLDEPTTGFDPQARRQFWAMVRGLRAEHGTTMLLSTHYLEEAEALAGRVVVLAAGRVVASGDPATLGGRAGGRATVGWVEQGRPASAETDDPARLVVELTARNGGTVPGLTVTRPSLEDVYLDLIGERR